MRLFSGKVPPLAQELVRALIQSRSIEVEDSEVPEVILDVESVLKEYIRVEREITDQARDIIASQKRSHSDLKKIRMQVARERSIGIDEDAIEYLINQIIETLIHSRHVEEVFGADNELAVQMAPILRKYLAAEEELDAEVRRQIRNLQEGTTAFDVQYRRIREELKRAKKLDLN